MSRLCEISLLRRKIRGEINELDARRARLVSALDELDAAFDQERQRLQERDRLKENAIPNQRRWGWADEVEWSIGDGDTPTIDLGDRPQEEKR